MIPRLQIMIVEDDSILAGEIKGFLERWGYFAHIAQDFETIADECRDRNPHLILMDINLPYYDGFYWCRKIREFSEVPILYISSRDGDDDKIQAYVQGGDDYVEKPFRLQLLQAKVEAILRRTYHYHAKAKVFFSEKLSFEPGSQELIFDGTRVELTKSERKILARLAERPGEVVSREELMVTLWNTDEFVSDGTLTVLISRLRSKLSSCCGEEIIRTRKGQGYYIPV